MDSAAAETQGHASLPRERIHEIDWLKGCAILAVICIHARVSSGTWIHERVIDHAVPVFLVLFGVSSELWWRQAMRQQPRSVVARWYRTRLLRLMVPVWTAFTLWWVIAVATGVAARRGLDLRHFAASYVGFAPWIGVSWFVTIIVQLVALFPLIRWLVDALGAIFSLIVSAIITAACALYLWDIVAAGKWLFDAPVPEPGWWYQWTFSPRMLWHVTAGIVLARAGVRPSHRLALAALALWSLLLGLEHVVDDPSDPIGATLRRHALSHLAEVPLTVMLLYALRALRPEMRLARVLALCGMASWGIYLGQLLVHELFHMLGQWPENADISIRAAYALTLLAGGATLMRLGAAARDRLTPIQRAARAA